MRATLRRPRFWAALALSALCLWLAVRDVPLARLAAALEHADYVWLLPGLALQVLAVAARAERWVTLLDRPDRRVDAFWAHSVGFLFTNIFPLRMGEPARVVIMAERTGQPVMRVAASAVVERLLDIATIVGALALVLPRMQVPLLVRRAGVVFGAAAAAALLTLWLMARRPEIGERAIRSLASRVPALPAEGLLARWGEAVAGLAPLTRPVPAFWALLWSAVSWGLSFSIYACVLRAFQPQAAWVESVFMVVALSLAITVPSSPGFIGVFQFIGQQALVLPFGGKYDASTALAITLTVYLLYYLTTSGLGLIGLWRFGESLAHLGRQVLDWQKALRRTPVE